MNNKNTEKCNELSTLILLAMKYSQHNSNDSNDSNDITDKFIKQMLDKVDRRETLNGGRSYLIYAAMYGYPNLVMHLIDTGLDNEDDYGFTALHYAIKNEQLGTTLTLLPPYINPPFVKVVKKEKTLNTAKELLLKKLNKFLTDPSFNSNNLKQWYKIYRAMQSGYNSVSREIEMLHMNE